MQVENPAGTFAGTAVGIVADIAVEIVADTAVDTSAGTAVDIEIEPELESRSQLGRWRQSK